MLKPNVFDDVVEIRGVGHVLGNLLDLVCANERRVAAVGWVFGMDDANSGNGDVFEEMEVPAGLEFRRGFTFPGEDAWDGNVGVRGFYCVVVGVVEDGMNRGAGVILQAVGLAEEGTDLLIVGRMDGEGVEVVGEVNEVERGRVDGHAF